MMRRAPSLLLLLLAAHAGAWSGEVTLKLAIDANGAVDDLVGKSGRFTSPKSLDMVHYLRRASDAVLVGASTVDRDDPALTVRRVAAPPTQPKRVVLDPNGRCRADSAVFADGLASTVVFARDPAARSLPAAVAVEPLAADGGAAAAIAGVVAALEGRHDVSKLMVEGGPFTARAFLDAGLVDRAIIVRAPMAFSGDPVPSGIDAAALAAAGLAFHSRRDLDGDDVQTWCRGATPPIWDCLLDGGEIPPKKVPKKSYYF